MQDGQEYQAAKVLFLVCFCYQGSPEVWVPTELQSIFEIVGPIRIIVIIMIIMPISGLLGVPLRLTEAARIIVAKSQFWVGALLGEFYLFRPLAQSQGPKP